MKFRNFMNLSYFLLHREYWICTASDIARYARLRTCICVSLTLPTWLDHSYLILFYFRNGRKDHMN